MNLLKAIEIKARTGEEFLHTDPDEVDEADSLSIEAMKRIIVERPRCFSLRHPKLPGETED